MAADSNPKRKQSFRALHIAEPSATKLAGRASDAKSCWRESHRNFVAEIGAPGMIPSISLIRRTSFARLNRHVTEPEHRG
jgi:hypothetical protein